MKQKNRERLGIGMKIGAGVLALIMIIGVVIQDLVQRHRSRTGQRRAILIQNGKLAQVDAVVGHSSIAFHL